MLADVTEMHFVAIPGATAVIYVTKPPCLAFRRRNVHFPPDYGGLLLFSKEGASR